METLGIKGSSCDSVVSFCSVFIIDLLTSPLANMNTINEWPFSSFVGGLQLLWPLWPYPSVAPGPGSVRVLLVIARKRAQGCVTAEAAFKRDAFWFPPPRPTLFNTFHPFHVGFGFLSASSASACAETSRQRCLGDYAGDGFSQIFQR